MAYFYDKRAKMLLFLHEDTQEIEVMQEVTFKKVTETKEVHDDTASTPPRKKKAAPEAGDASRRRAHYSETQINMVRDLIKEGKMKPAEIAEEAEVKPPFVYLMKAKMKQEGAI